MSKLAPKTEGPLAGLIVVDLTRVLAGPYCTLLLGDLGARIIKVEAPGHGDDARSAGPFIPNPSGWDPFSAYFFSANRNKESIALDLKDPGDREIFEALVASADILVENFRPGVMEKLGYGWQDLHARFPQLIMASISGFGQTGPYRQLPAYDMVVQAMGGVMSLTGEEDGAPTRVGISIGDLAAGMFGAIGIQGALHERTSTSVGRRIDVAMLDSQVALLENALARYQIEGVVPGPIGSRHPSITPFATFSAEDGDMVVAAGNDTMFVRLCDALGAPHLKFDPRFATNGNRTENHRALAAAIEAVLTLRPVSDWLDRLNAAGVACAPLNDVADVMNDPHVLHRGMLIDLPTPGGGTLRVAGSPIKLDGGSQTKFQRAPLLDEHRLAILNELGLTTE